MSVNEEALATMIASSNDENNVSGRSSNEGPGPYMPIASWSHLKWPGLIAPAAFSYENRIRKQIAECTGIPIEEVTDIFETLNLPETDTCFKDMTKFATHVRTSLYQYHGRRLERMFQHDNPACHIHPLVYTIWSGRAYFYTGAAYHAREDGKKFTGQPPSIRLTELSKSEKLPSETTLDFKPFPWHIHDPGQIPAGKYWTYFRNEDNPTFQQLLEIFEMSGRHPNINYTRIAEDDGHGGLNTYYNPCSFDYHKTAIDQGERGTITVRCYSKWAESIPTWAEILKAPYAGQQMPSFANMVFDRILRDVTRRELTDNEKTTVLDKQRGLCNMCRDKLDAGAEFDHRVPLSRAGTQDIENFQALCISCHGTKTVQETQGTSPEYSGRLRSSFCKQVWKAYVESPKPPTLVYKSADQPDLPCIGEDGNRPMHDHLAVDVIKCRRNALYNCEYLPVFTVLDEMEPVDLGAKGVPDLTYIERPKFESLSEVLASLPLTGTGWYAKPAIEYALHIGVLQASDLLWGVYATGRCPGDEVRRVIDRMESAWDEIEGATDRCKKDCIIQLVGFWGMDTLTKVRKWKTMDEADEPSWWGKNTKNPETGMLEYTQEIAVLDSGTYRPLYDYALAVEHTRVAQALYAMRTACKMNKLDMPKVLQLTTDGFIFKRPRKASTTDALKDITEGITQQWLSNLRGYVFRSVHPEAQKELRGAPAFPLTGLYTDAKVFKFVVPLARQHLRGQYSLDRLQRSWSVGDPKKTWRYVSREQAMECVLDDQSLLVLGLAGTGKSHFIRNQILPALQTESIATTAPTHNAAFVAGGHTCEHWNIRHVRQGGSNVHVHWADEISMMNIQHLKDINHESFRQEPKVQFILSGDFEQYRPFFNTFMGQPVTKSLQGSALLHSLCDGNVLVMSECMRSDGELFDFYSSIIHGGRRFNKSLKHNIREARALFCRDKATGFIPGTQLAPTNLVISHKRRVGLNAECNDAEAKFHEATRVLFKVEDFTEGQQSNQAQTAYFWPGMDVVACCRSSGKLKNGRRYKIQEIQNSTVTLRGGEEDEPVVLSTAKFFQDVRLPYAITQQSAQGLTLEGLIAVWDTDNPFFDHAKLYVCTSRATSARSLIVH